MQIPRQRPERHDLIVKTENYHRGVGGISAHIVRDDVARFDPSGRSGQYDRGIPNTC